MVYYYEVKINDIGSQKYVVQRYCVTLRGASILHLSWLSALSVTLPLKSAPSLTPVLLEAFLLD